MCGPAPRCARLRDWDRRIASRCSLPGPLTQGKPFHVEGKCADVHRTAVIPVNGHRLSGVNPQAPQTSTLPAPTEGTQPTPTKRQATSLARDPNLKMAALADLSSLQREPRTRKLLQGTWLGGKRKVNTYQCVLLNPCPCSCLIPFRPLDASFRRPHTRFVRLHSFSISRKPGHTCDDGDDDERVATAT
jgi:hypothetical protein